jgi:DNA topoisomerase I
MSYELIITEKPSAALKIASALADGSATKRSESTVSYYELTHNGKPIKVASAVGHLFTVAENSDKKWNYPQFDIKWVQSSTVNKASAFTKKYVNVIKKLSKDADEFTVATDYDIEGEVIGYNVIAHICKQKDANRMKYSTLTKEELIKSYEGKQSHLDWGQAHAGVTRHELDWYYGINLSRALTHAIKAAGTFKTLSSGRVQGPALKLLVDKERDISAFIPDPYWQIRLDGEVRGAAIEAWYKNVTDKDSKNDKIFDEQKAKDVYEKTKGQPASVSEVSAKQFKQQPPYPFDLTSMQIEAYRVFKVQPKITLSLAQDLYIGGFISYPRTSSQKLPKELGYKKLLTALTKNSTYKELAEKLLKQKVLKPNEGKKKDDAHPAIYPTGVIPAKLTKDQQRIYDLIVRRFLATFAGEATRETMTINVDIKSEIFIAKGTRTVDKGWHEFYGPYAIFDEVTLPAVEKNDDVIVKKLEKLSKETKPPKRYTPASVIKELEKRNLGTKATRASIVDNLYDRGYVKAKSIEVTDLGIKTVATLEKYSPQILEEQLTRQIEEEMEEIRQEKKKPEEVKQRTIDVLTVILEDFKKKEKDIGEELKKALFESNDKENSTIPCPICKEGTMMIKRGKFGRFLACSRYPDCTTTVSLPKKGKIIASEKPCEKCGHPMLSIQTARKAPQLVCVNPKCKTNEEVPEDKREKIEGEGKECEKCKKGTMVLRKSIYGEFLGCSNYPKCKNVVNIKKKAEKKE